MNTAIQLMHEPKLFSTPNNNIPKWVMIRYRNLTLIADEKGMLPPGYQAIADHLGCSKPFAIKIMKWLERLKLVAVAESGSCGRGKSTIWQIRRWFFKVSTIKGNQPPYKVYKKNLKTNTFGDDPRNRRYSMKHLREAVDRVKTLSQDQRHTLTNIIGKLIWKAKIQRHQIKELWQWLTNILPHYEKLRLRGRQLALWFIGKIQRFASPSTDRWRREYEEERRKFDEQAQAEWNAPDPPEPQLSDDEFKKQHLEVLATLVDSGMMTEEQAKQRHVQALKEREGK